MVRVFAERVFVVLKEVHSSAIHAFRGLCLRRQCNGQDVQPRPYPDRYDRPARRELGRLDWGDGVDTLMHRPPGLDDSRTHRGRCRHRLDSLCRRDVDLVCDRKEDCLAIVAQSIPRAHRRSPHSSSRTSECDRLVTHGNLRNGPLHGLMLLSAVPLRGRGWVVISPAGPVGCQPLCSPNSL